MGHLMHEKGKGWGCSGGGFKGVVLNPRELGLLITLNENFVDSIRLEMEQGNNKRELRFCGKISKIEI